jgi:hypothetical protein
MDVCPGHIPLVTTVTTQGYENFLRCEDGFGVFDCHRGPHLFE